MSQEEYSEPGSSTLPGRQDKLDLLKELLDKPHCRGVVIQGLPGIGKTEFLSHFANWLPTEKSKRHFRVARPDPFDERAELGGIAVSMAKSMACSLGEPPIVFGENPETDFENWLPKLSKRLESNHRLVLLLDGDCERLADYVHRLLHLGPWTRLQFVVAVDMNDRLSNITSLNIGPLEGDAAKEMLQGEAGRGLDLSHEAIARIQQMTNGHPHFIMELCRLLRSQLREQKSKEQIEVAAVDDARDQFLETDDSRLFRLWGSLSKQERVVLAAAAPFEESKFTLDQLTSEVKHIKHLDSGSVNNALFHLKEKCLLKSEGPDNYLFPGEIIRLWAERKLPEVSGGQSGTGEELESAPKVDRARPKGSAAPLGGPTPGRVASRGATALPGTGTEEGPPTSVERLEPPSLEAVDRPTGSPLEEGPAQPETEVSENEPGIPELADAAVAAGASPEPEPSDTPDLGDAEDHPAESDPGTGPGVTKGQGQPPPPRRLLQAKNLTIKAFDGQPILKGLSVDLYQRDILFLVGESGSGKTTFIRLCLGILPSALTFEEGELEYFASEIALDREGGFRWDVFHRHAGTALGYCPQDPFSRFNSRKPLARQLLVSDLARRWRRSSEKTPLGHSEVPTLDGLLSAILDLGSKLRDAGLRTEDLWALPRQRSHGYIQRLGLTQIPEDLSILFLDEPFNALDLVTRQRLVEHCVELLRSGSLGALVCATHDHQFIKSVVDAAREPELCCIKQDIVSGKVGPLAWPYPRPDVEKDLTPSRVEIQEKKSTPIHIGPLESTGRILHLIFDQEPLRYRHGEIVGIVGSSNSGKTTLGKHLCGWDVRRGIRDERQYVPQDPFSCFSPGLPVKACCPDLEAAIGELVEDRAEELIPLLDRPPGNLSGGQLQRLRILAAMARIRTLEEKSTLLFLDEPFAHQDPEWVKSLTALVCDATGKTVDTSMVVSHDIELLLRFCNRIVLLTEFYFRTGRDAMVLTLPFVDAHLGQESRVDLVGQLEEKLDAGGLEARLSDALSGAMDKALDNVRGRVARKQKELIYDEAHRLRAEAVEEVKLYLRDLIQLLRHYGAVAA